MSHQNLRLPGFGPECEVLEREQAVPHPKKRRRLTRFTGSSAKIGTSEGDESDAEYTSSLKDEPGDIYSELSLYSDSDAAGNRRRAKSENKKEVFTSADDGNERQYQARLRQWMQERKKAREREYVTAQREAPEGIEWTLPHPTVPDYIVENGYRIPGDIYPSLFDYQKTCVQWLWELHQQNVGGIIGDEMGLGKTIQIISFLAGLHYSGKLTKPILVVTPATVLKQWVNEFHKWWPPLRVPILHSSGSGMLDVNNEEDVEDMLELGHEPVVNNKQGPAAEKLVNRVFEKGPQLPPMVESLLTSYLGHALVTTYAGIQTYGPLLLEREWGYAILDEGHKIRNPDARISLACKQLKVCLHPAQLGAEFFNMDRHHIELFSLGLQCKTI